MRFLSGHFQLMDLACFLLYGPLMLVAAMAISPRGLGAIGFGGLVGLGFMAGFCLWGLGRIVFGPMWRHNGWFMRVALSFASSVSSLWRLSS